MIGVSLQPLRKLQILSNLIIYKLLCPQTDTHRHITSTQDHLQIQATDN